MPIDAVKQVPQYRIDASGETTDQERRREEKLRDKRATKKHIAPNMTDPSVNNPTPKAVVASDLESVSQNVDTSRVIELLKPRESTQKQSPQEAFKVRKMAEENSETPIHQHVDKRY